MRAELECGNCGSRLELESYEEYDESIFSLIHRFSNAHVGCGFVTSGIAADQVSTGANAVVEDE